MGVECQRLGLLRVLRQWEGRPKVKTICEPTRFNRTGRKQLKNIARGSTCNSSRMWEGPDQGEGLSSMWEE